MSTSRENAELEHIPPSKMKAPGCPGVLESSALCTYEGKGNREAFTLSKDGGMLKLKLKRP